MRTSLSSFYSNLSSLYSNLLTPLRDLDVDLRFNSRSPTSGHANSPYLLLPDTPADHLYALAGVMPAGHKASPTCLIGTSQRTCNVRSSPGGMERRPEMPGFAVACPSLEAAPPPPLHEALAMTGGVDGKAHRKLLEKVDLRTWGPHEVEMRGKP